MAKNRVYDALALKVVDRPAGWGQPRGQRHAHRYAPGDMLSACGRALYFGPVTPRPPTAGAICKTCHNTPTEGQDQ